MKPDNKNIHDSAQPSTTQIVNPADILTPDELAERLKTSRGWVFEMTRQRQRNPIPHYKIGRYLRFHWPDVCAWLEETRVTTTRSEERSLR